MNYELSSMSDNINLRYLARLSYLDFANVFFNRIEKLMLEEPSASNASVPPEQKIKKTAEAISAWNHALLDEGCVLTHIYAQSWDALNAPLRENLEHNIGIGSKGFDKTFFIVRNNLLNLHTLRKNENKFSQANRETTADGSSQKSKELHIFPKSEAEIAGRLAIPGQELFRIMKELSINGFPDAAKVIQSIAFPLYDLKRLTSESEFTISALAQTSDEFVSLPNIANEAKLKKAEALVLLKNIEKATSCAAIKSINWPGKAQELSRKDFASALLHKDERYKNNKLIETNGYLEAARAFQSFLNTLTQLNDFSSGISVGDQVRDGTSKETPSKGYEKLLNEIVDAQGQRTKDLSSSEKGAFADRAWALFYADISRTIFSALLENKCPKTVKLIRALSTEHIKAFKSELAPKISEEKIEKKRQEQERYTQWLATASEVDIRLKAYEKNLEKGAQVDARQELEDRTVLREEYKDDLIKAAATLPPSRFALFILHPYEAEPHSLLKNASYMAFSNTFQMFVLANAISKNSEIAKDITVNPSDFSGIKNNKTLAIFEAFLDFSKKAPPNEKQKAETVGSIQTSLNRYIKDCLGTVPYTINALRRDIEKQHVRYPMDKPKLLLG